MTDCTDVPTVEPVAENNDLRCGERVGLRSDGRTGEWSDVSPPTLDADAILPGDTLTVSCRWGDLGLPDDDQSEHTFDPVLTVERLRRDYDGRLTDLWGETPSGHRLHVYPTRGKVEVLTETDDDDAPGVSTMVNTFGHVEPAHVCADDSTCGRSPSQTVEVGGVTVATCTQHREKAIAHASNVSGIEVAEPEVTSRPEEGAEAYDVSETREKLEEKAAKGRCDRCGFPVVPDEEAEGGHYCPRCEEPRSPDGRVPATDGGAVTPSERDLTLAERERHGDAEGFAAQARRSEGVEHAEVVERDNALYVGITFHRDATAEAIGRVLSKAEGWPRLDADGITSATDSVSVAGGFYSPMVAHDTGRLSVKVHVEEVEG